MSQENVEIVERAMDALLDCPGSEWRRAAVM
jgi:hypothetical protein